MKRIRSIRRLIYNEDNNGRRWTSFEDNFTDFIQKAVADDEDIISIIRVDKDTYEIFVLSECKEE